MKKIYNLTLLLLLCSNDIFAQSINPNWSFVGPRSENDQNGNKFLTSRIERLSVNPGNPNHIVAGGHLAGLWQSTDGGLSWTNLNTTPIGSNGVSGVAFRNGTELYVGGYIEYSSKVNYSTGVYKYDFSTSSWQILGSITTQKYIIHRIVVFPGNSNIIFVCTNIGLFKSVNAGVSWSQVNVTGNIYNIVFIKKTNGIDYFWYISGSTLPGGYFQGNALFMESTDDGLSFNNIFMNQYSTTSVAIICLGKQTAGSGDRDIYICAAVQNTSQQWDDITPTYIHKCTKNINSGAISATTIIASTTDWFADPPDRFVLGYDEANNYLLIGRRYLYHINLSIGPPFSLYTYSSGNSNRPNTYLWDIHDDIHDIYINNSNNQIFIGGDGGFHSASFNSSASPSRYDITTLNNQLDIAMINGFSGASDNPNIYVMGLQDHLVTDYYDASVPNSLPSPDNFGQTTGQHPSEENDGALIVKFNNNLIISDHSSINSYYYTSAGDPTNFSNNYTTDLMYSINNPQGYYYEPGAPLVNQYGSSIFSQSFGRHPFFQDPFRPNRIYNTGKGGCIFQFDPVSNKFVLKVRFQDELAHFTNSPTLKSEYCLGWCPVDTTSNRLFYLGWQPQPIGISFSQQDKNSMHVVTSSDNTISASQVVKYIGNTYGLDLDNVWAGTAHEHNDGNSFPSKPYWQLITPNWLGAPFNISNANREVYHIQFTGVETSNWNKNKIYVTCASDISGFPYKVIVFNGSTWSDYTSTGIPSDETVVSMVMDHASNDGIYLSTEKGVYYRDAGMGVWLPYKTGLPLIRSMQMEINYKENSVRAGTYGRGIWKSQLACPSNSGSYTIPLGMVSGYKESNTILTTSGSVNTTPTSGSTVFRGTTSVILLPGFTADATIGTNYFQAFIHGCTITNSPSGGTSTYNYYRQDSPGNIQHMLESIESNRELKVYPNPTSGMFTLLLGNNVKYEKDEEGKFENKMEDENPETYSVNVYNSIGEIVYSKQSIFSSTTALLINMQSQEKGIYLVRVVKNNSEVKTVKIIVQ